MKRQPERDVDVGQSDRFGTLEGEGKTFPKPTSFSRKKNIYGVPVDLIGIWVG